MRKFSFIVWFISIAQYAAAQPDSTLHTTLFKSLYTDITDFTTDNLGNIYILNTTGQIKKLNAKGDSVAVFNDVRKHGKVYSIDATNPLKVLIYYRDFSTIVVLDRLLNIRNAIDLRKRNLFQVKAIATSYDNNIWLYDELESKVKKIDDNGNTLLQTADFRQLYDSVPSPEVMYDRDGQLYIYDSKRGLLVFDYYGAQKNDIALKDVYDLQVIDKNTITGRNNYGILLYKPTSLQLYSFRISSPISDFIKLQFNGTRLYGLTKNGIIQIFQTP